MNDKRFRGKVPIRETLETIEWMQQLLGADEVYAILPDLLFSTDDTTLFAFEGCKDTGEWAWKLVDKSRGDTLVRRNFTVGDDLENGGGLRVRVTFTLLATGQFAPVLISFSGLTEEELSQESCPDGILATKLFGVGKGGRHDVWLTSMRKKKPKQELQHHGRGHGHILGCGCHEGTKTIAHDRAKNNCQKSAPGGHAHGSDVDKDNKERAQPQDAKGAEGAGAS